MTALIQQTVGGEMTALRDSMDRLIMGSPHPLVPVQPTQVTEHQGLGHLGPPYPKCVSARVSSQIELQLVLCPNVLFSTGICMMSKRALLGFVILIHLEAS